MAGGTPFVKWGDEYVWLEGRIDLDAERLAEHAAAVFLAVRDSMRILS